MYSRIEVFFKDEFSDALGNKVRSEIETFGFQGITDIRVCQVYIIFGNLSKNDLDTIARKLLSDMINQHYELNPLPIGRSNNSHIVEVSRKPGVMDPVEQSVLKAFRDIGIKAD